MAHGSVKQGGELSPLLTVDDACIALGISRSAGYRAIAAGALPAVRWGRRVYVPSGHLVSLLGTTADAVASAIARHHSEQEAAMLGRVTMRGVGQRR
jgi:excisionase family DNA binding protein